jgi:hypothetical protein
MYKSVRISYIPIIVPAEFVNVACCFLVIVMQFDLEVKVKVKVKDKVRPRTGHEGPWGDYRALLFL